MDFIQFTYKNDVELTELSIKSIFKNCSEIGVVIIINDQNNPISEEKLIELKSIYGPKLKTINTTWDRNGNLLGISHFKNYIRLLKDLKDKKILNSRTIVKIDPDSIVLKDNLLKSFDKSENVYGGDFLFSEWYAVGSFYWFKSYMIEPMLWSLKHWGEYSPNEDVEFGHRIICLANKIDLRTQTKDLKIEDIRYIDKKYDRLNNVYIYNCNAKVDLIQGSNIELFGAGYYNQYIESDNSKRKQKECLEKILKLN